MYRISLESLDIFVFFIVCGCICVCMYVWMDGWMDVWVNGCMYGWIDEGRMIDDCKMVVEIRLWMDRMNGWFVA